jgi:hypothetical protein
MYTEGPQFEPGSTHFLRICCLSFIALYCSGLVQAVSEIGKKGLLSDETLTDVD